MDSCLSWRQLRERMREIFSSDSVNVEEVKRVMSAYRSCKSDWSEFAHFDTYKYTRNLVDEGNGKYNLLVLCWGEGHVSPIHDHTDSHCFMKMLDGSLKETLFSWPQGCCHGNGGEALASRKKEEGEKELESMSEIGSHTYHSDDVTYINDSIGLHRVENPSHTDQAISLHLYAPPITICRSFEQRTGQSCQCKVTFYSREGRVEPCRAERRHCC